MADVFISYAREDREAATKLAHALEDRGYSVWWDPVIPPGKTWAEVIGTQLGAASCVVALWSAVSVTKRWVRKEATFADERKKLIPAKLEDVTIPFAFADVQAADLTGWEGNSSHEGFQHLVSAISEQLRNPPSEQVKEDIVVATEQAKAQLAESEATQDRPPYTGAKTEKLSLKAAWERFRAHVGPPDRQTLLSKKAIIIGGVSVVLVSLLFTLVLQTPTDMEFGINRPGQDFQNFDLSSADPALCESACSQKENCRAWTYVMPNTIQGPNPRCWLKTGIPNPVNDPCCVSGVKGGSSDRSK